MKILGYSERGILNSLLYEIRYHANGDALFHRLIGEATFPEGRPPTGSVTVLVEQSLSDFGDADAIVLIDSGARKCAVFIEAKVKTRGSSDWRLSDQFSDFVRGVNSEDKQKPGFSSNIFTQIYYKQKFMMHDICKLKKGVPFPAWSTKQKRKIGANEAVLRAAEKIKSYCDKTFYLMLIPDDKKRVEKFFASDLPAPDWDVSHYGYLTWRQVECFCGREKLKNSLAVFGHNAGQIY